MHCGDRGNGVHLTIDIEDHSHAASRARFDGAIEPLLVALRDSGVRATFFVVGSLAKAWASTITELANEGHEIALHGYEHSFIERLGEQGFRDDIRRGVSTLAELLGRAPAGYRAPYFSLTRATPWAPAILTDAGIKYSSSVLPAWNPQAGLPGAPRGPFMWPSGLVELPAPVFGVGQAALPLLGGAYLRLAPRPLIGLAARGAGYGAWTYAHPYDFDVSETFTRLKGQQWWVTRLLFMRRELMLKRVMSLVGAESQTLSTLVSTPGFSSTLDEFRFSGI